MGEMMAELGIVLLFTMPLLLAAFLIHGARTILERRGALERGESGL